MLDDFNAKSFQEIQEEEREILAQKWPRIHPPSGTDTSSARDCACRTPQDDKDDDRTPLVGLAFSGGGIRSATLGVGLLQGLAQVGMLSRVNYLSTVSGGGYVGGFLEAWVYRCHFEQRLNAIDRRLRLLVDAALKRKSDDLTLHTQLKRLEQGLPPPAPASEESKRARGHASEETSATGRAHGPLEPELPLRKRVEASSELLLELEAVHKPQSACARARTRKAAHRVAVTVVHALPDLECRVDKLMCAWIPDRRQRQVDEQTPIEFLQEKLKQNARRQPTQRELYPLRFLREHSNYLTPRTGMFTPDAWTVVAIYLRNLALNALILLLALGSVLLAVHAYVALHGTLETLINENPTWATAVGSLGLLCGVCAVGVSVLALGQPDLTNLSTDPYSRLMRWLSQHRRVYRLLVIPLLIWSVLTSFLFMHMKTHLVAWALMGSVYAIAYASVWGIAFKVDRARRSLGDAPQEARSSAEAGITGWDVFVGTLVAAALGVAAKLALAAALAPTFTPDPAVDGVQPSSLYGVPLLLLCLGGMITAQLGLVGRGLSEYVREWGSRLVAHLCLLATATAILSAVTIDWPIMLEENAKYWALWTQGIAVGWLGTTLAGLWSVRKGASSSELSVLRRALISAAPHVFSLGALLLLALGVHRFARAEVPQNICGAVEGVLQSVGLFHGRGLHCGALVPPAHQRGLVLLAEAVAAGLAAAVLSWRIGINEFSLHALYRNRVVRCYLGAVRGLDRGADPFTGFDADDDSLRLDELFPREHPQGPPFVQPFWLINATLNLVVGQRLAWQFRRASSFVFSPLYSGYEPRFARPEGTEDVLDDNGYRKTARYGGGIRLGTAVAISGAALSPNMGARTSPAMAFLMTLFNVRLGWWLGNPRNQGSWRKAGPTLGLVQLVVELLGRANDTRRYVYLSDGGHFENLGIYELVHRRCRYIIACDGSEDRSSGFADLGNAIEKCRTDFGVEIDIDITPLKPDAATGLSCSHFAVGQIRYAAATDDGPGTGVLVYLKSSMTGDEPVDVQAYRRSHPEFPHQSTADQWFDETQFESYRALGEHLAFATFDPGHDCQEMPVETLFTSVRQRAFSSVETRMAFARHRENLSKIYERQRSMPTLRFLDEQIYPGWTSLINHAPSGHGAAPARGQSASQVSEQRRALEKRLWLPDSPEEVRAGFYFCQELIGVMENVFIELRLDATHDHPDHRGWMNLFHHWSWCGMFRVTWAMVASTTEMRFQTFCRDVLGLKVDTVTPEIVQSNAHSLLDFRRRDMPEDVYRLPLNYREMELLRELSASPQDDADKATWRCFSLAVKVVSPANTDDQASLPVSFGLIHDRTLVYLRTQDHLRKAGFARITVKTLLKEKHIRRCVPLKVQLKSEPITESCRHHLEALFWSERQQLEDGAQAHTGARERGVSVEGHVSR